MNDISVLNDGLCLLRYVVYDDFGLGVQTTVRTDRPRSRRLGGFEFPP